MRSDCRAQHDVKELALHKSVSVKQLFMKDVGGVWHLGRCPTRKCK